MPLLNTLNSRHFCQNSNWKTVFQNTSRTWVAKFEAGELKKDYFFVGSQKECEEIVESNKALYSSRMGANS
ncbi:hypothetical protein EA691_05175 [Acinetobacter baumannii]|nr:hypothetical protein EA711_04890 [Acinetobacter baumannii]RSR05275.1 hypothetical protein EA691_05175 [Acinetobacter baumannii]